MTDLDAFGPEPGPPNLGAPVLRTKHRHRWAYVQEVDGVLHHAQCVDCGTRRDEVRVRRGKSASRLGKDQERRIERVYGPRKVGEFGDAIDLLGRDFMWQSKATRSAPRLWATNISPIASIGPTVLITSVFEAMRALRQDKAPLLIRSWVRSGVPTIDIVIVRGDDWADMHGGDQAWGYLAMTGQHFLDVHGRDEP